MKIHTETVRDFLAALDKWLRALERRDQADAGFYAREVAQRGRTLAADPTFGRFFERHRGACRPEFDPYATIECIGAFVQAVSSAHEHTLAAADGNGRHDGLPHGL